jgi:hypothetical protein
MSTDLSHELVIARTRAWVRRSVVGLNLCPFARAVETRAQIRYVVNDTDDAETLLDALCDELRDLAAADPDETATTLLIHPNAFGDFLDFNDFLGDVDDAVEALGLTGVMQVASFHPDYQFAGSEPDDIENATNRAPYPTLHLLREAMVERAVAAVPDVDAIVDANIHTLQQLGNAGWAHLQQQMDADAAADVAGDAAGAGPRGRAVI